MGSSMRSGRRNGRASRPEGGRSAVGGQTKVWRRMNKGRPKDGRRAVEGRSKGSRRWPKGVGDGFGKNYQISKKLSTGRNWVHKGAKRQSLRSNKGCLILVCQYIIEDLHKNETFGRKMRRRVIERRNLEIVNNFWELLVFFGKKFVFLHFETK